MVAGRPGERSPLPEAYAVRGAVPVKSCTDDEREPTPSTSDATRVTTELRPGWTAISRTPLAHDAQGHAEWGAERAGGECSGAAPELGRGRA
jgi:hypothetical protein